MSCWKCFVISVSRHKKSVGTLDTRNGLTPTNFARRTSEVDNGGDGNCRSTYPLLVNIVYNVHNLRS